MKLQVATLCVVVLILLVLTVANNQNNNENYNLTEEEETILAALLGSSTSSNEENIVEEANSFKKVLSGQRQSTVDKEKLNERDTDEEIKSDEDEKPKIVDKAVAHDNNDFWTLMKRQVASDFAPILAIIPAPIKSNIATLALESKTMLLTVLYGALKPTLLTASKLLHHASLGLLQFVDVLNQHNQASISRNKRSKNKLLERAENHLKKRKAMKKQVQNEAVVVGA